MEKMIITKYGRIIDPNSMESVFRKSMDISCDSDKIAPFAVFALMKNGEIVNIGSFTDCDTAEIIEILLGIFTNDKKDIFNISLEEYGISEVLELLRYVAEGFYPAAVKSLKDSLKNGELDVSFA